MIYTNINPQTYEDVFKLYHYAIYPHYLSNTPAIYAISNIKKIFNKLESISDPAPVSCPLTGEKAVRHLQRLPVVKDQKSLDEWLKRVVNDTETVVSVKTPLAPDQEKAASHFIGPAITISPAGSGKTTTIVVRITLLIKRGIPPEKILCITFTKKAQKEMQNRLISALGKEIGKKITVKTYHALAYYLMHYFTGRKPEIITDREPIINEIIAELEEAENVQYKDINSYISYQLNNLILPDDIEPKSNSEEYKKLIYAKYLEKLQVKEIADQDYLLFKTCQILSTQKNMRLKLMDYGNSKDNKYPKGLWQFILIDEAQDNNLAQDVLTRFLGAPWDNIFWVGDEDQLLYSFRGSSVERILGLDNVYPNIEEIYLTTNYRCHPEIIEKADNLIRHNQNRRPKEIKAGRKSNKRAVFCQLKETMLEEYEWVARKIQYLLKKGCQPDDIGILYRTNAQGDAIGKCLEEKEIPHFIHRTGDSLFNSLEMEIVLNHLSLLKNPRDTEKLIACLKLPSRTGKIEFYKKELAGVLYPLDTLRTLAEQKRDMKVIEFCEDIRLAALIAKNLRNTGEIIKIIRSRLEDIENYFSYDEESERLNIIQEIASKFDKPEEFINWIIKVKAQNNGESNSSTEGKVQLMTVHASKGLEFSEVFLVNCTEGFFPHTKGLLEEERRIFYVGMTRAINKLYLTGFNNDNRSASRFLWEAKVIQFQ